jgi:hypothetical protein
LNISGIAFDADATATAIKVGSGGWNYGLHLPNNIGVIMGTVGGSRAEIVFGGTDLSISSSGTVQISSEILGDNGAEGAPAYSFISDDDTGIYRAAADTIGLASGGNTPFTFAFAGGVGGVLRFNDTGLRLRNISDIEFVTMGGFGSSWTFTSNVGAVTFSQRVLQSQGADVASANDLTLGGDGNTFEITGNTQINAITTANWQNGALITLLFTSNPTVKHNTAGGAGTAVMLLAGAADFGATAGGRTNRSSGWASSFRRRCKPIRRRPTS